MSKEFSYYPGCSLHSTGCEFGASVRASLAELDIELKELEDWNCCGASSAHSASHSLALALPARNLAIAQAAGRDVMMPCAACFNRHQAADAALRSDAEQRQWLEREIGFEFDGRVRVRPLLDILGNEIGIDTLHGKVKRPLAGLKVAGYYGCLLLRPPGIVRFENPEHPILMDRILDALGAEPRPWSHATDCCGGGLSLTRSNIAARLVSHLEERAREAGAEAIVTSCPLCQVNLEMRQAKGQKMPVFYITELVGLALGLEAADQWWGKHLITPLPLLSSVGLAS